MSYKHLGDSVFHKDLQELMKKEVEAKTKMLSTPIDFEEVILCHFLQAENIKSKKTSTR